MAKYRKMLSNWDAPYIQSLIGLIETQSKETLIRWSADYAETRLLPIYEARFPHDPRPREAITAARRWLGKEIKLPAAKPAILACHEAAREADSDPTAQAAARAIGQSASTIHAPTHVAGLALYGALAVAYDALGIDTPWATLEQAAAMECAQMETALRAIAVENEPHPAKLNWRC